MTQNTQGGRSLCNDPRDKQLPALDMGWLEGASTNETAIVVEMMPVGCL